MKVLVDIGVGKAVETWLATQGIDVVAVRSIDPRMGDAAILHLAVVEQRVVITMDKDFGELVVRAGQSHAGVLLLRLDDARSEEKVAIVNQIFAQHADNLVGNFCIYQNGRLRIRRLR
jgi:predicted nuclease of predicted toxin-antitoxin system